MRLRGWAGCVLCCGLAACAPRAFTPPAAEDQSAPSARTAPAEAPAVPRATDDPRFRPYTAEGPAQVTADRMRYMQEGQVSVFTGRVRVTQGTTRLEAPYLEVLSRDGRAVARQGVRLTDPSRGLTVTAQELAYAQTLDNAQARGNVRLDSRDDQGEPLHLTCDRLDWDDPAQSALARGGVRATYRDITATAETLRYLHADQVLELKPPADPKGPRPRVEQAGSTLTGNAIFLRLRERIYEAQGAARADLEVSRFDRTRPAGRQERP